MKNIYKWEIEKKKQTFISKVKFKSMFEIMRGNSFQEHEKLFVMEFVVDRVNFNQQAFAIGSEDVWSHGETLVQFNFLDIPPIEIQHSDWTNCRITSQQVPKLGKSCLFALASNNPFRENFIVEMAINRRSFQNYATYYIGGSSIRIDHLFNSILESVILEPDKVPVCKTLHEKAIIYRGELPLGEITTIIRVTSLGRIIVNPFGLGKDMNELETLTYDNEKVFNFDPIELSSMPSNSIYIPPAHTRANIFCLPKTSSLSDHEEFPTTFLQRFSLSNDHYTKIRKKDKYFKGFHCTSKKSKTLKKIQRSVGTDLPLVGEKSYFSLTKSDDDNDSKCIIEQENNLENCFCIRVPKKESETKRPQQFKLSQSAAFFKNHNQTLFVKKQSVKVY